MREKMQGTSRLKALNQQAILRFLLRFEGATKSGIAQATGLSVAACTALLDEMIADGRVRELEHAAPRGGRPARRFALDAEREHLLALRCERGALEPGCVFGLGLCCGRACRAGCDELCGRALLCRGREAARGASRGVLESRDLFGCGGGGALRSHRGAQSAARRRDGNPHCLAYAAGICPGLQALYPRRPSAGICGGGRRLGGVHRRALSKPARAGARSAKFVCRNRRHMIYCRERESSGHRFAAFRGNICR